MSTMKAVRNHKCGGPDALRYEDAPRPLLGEVLAGKLSNGGSVMNAWGPVSFSKGGLFRALVAAVAIVAVGACASSSSLVNLWKDPGYQRSPMHTVFVIALKKNTLMRRTWEDAFVSELAKHGVVATPSYRQFPDAPPDTQQVVDAANAQSYDGILLVHKLPTETTQHYVPGYVTTRAVERGTPWTGRYMTHYRRIYTPGYTETDKLVRYQVEMWKPGEEGGLVWTGTTQTIDPTSSQDVNREISRLVVPELVKSDVIVAR